MMRIFIYLLCLSLFCCSAWSTSLSSEKKRMQLHQLSERIDILKKTLSMNETERATLTHQLEFIELEIGQLNENLQAIHQEITEQKTMIQTVQRRKEHDETQLKQQQTALTTQVRAAYILGHKDYFKFLLNQQDPSQLNRMLSYYRYINHAHTQHIEEYHHTLDMLKQTEDKLNTHIQTLQTLIADYHAQFGLLASKQLKRKYLIGTLDNQIQTQQEKLAAMLANKNTLETIVARLDKQQTRSSTVSRSFTVNRGTLLWPTAHRNIIAQFGSPIENTPLNYNGIIIKGTTGEPVRAIDDGRVVFAQWLRGFGLLLILDHGQGYMSLYGRNEQLLVQVGDIVHRGQTISKIGQTGGFETPGLYFAIRHNGKSLNPSQWIG